MAVMDEFRAEREAIKHGTPREKFDYFMDYYKWHVIIAVIAIAIIASSIYNAVTAKDSALSGILLNSYSTDSEDTINRMTQEFFTEHQIDPEEYELTLNTTVYYSNSDDAAASTDNYNTSQLILVQIAAGSLDFMTGDLETMSAFAYSEYFMDLSTVLTEEQMALYEPYFLYIDQAVLDTLMNSDSFDSDTTVTIPDFDKPETMEKPVPIFIDMAGSGYLTEFYQNTKKPPVFGITVNAPNTELTAKFVDLLMKEPEAGNEQ